MGLSCAQVRLNGPVRDPVGDTPRLERVASREVVPPQIKTLLGYEVDDSDAEVLEDWKARVSEVCKPCWELKYCPYGPLVEDFPLVPPVRASALKHHEYLTSCLESGTYGRGEDEKPLDGERRASFVHMVEHFDSEEYPEEVPAIIEEAQCRIFGHICPVMFTAEGFSETSEVRAVGRRSIPFKTKVRVARRDNYTCQVCGEHLRDDDMEFDHVIPVSKGGSGEEHNLRLTCFDCNRKKSDRTDEFLASLEWDAD